RPRRRRASVRPGARAPRRLHACTRRPGARRRLGRGDRGVPSGVPRARAPPGLRRGSAVSRAARRAAQRVSGGQTFQLISRRRLIGLTHGTMRSVRPGRGTDECVVRERYADEGPRVVVVADRSAELSFFSAPLPWLDKAEAMRCATDIVVASAAQAGGFVGYLDYADGDPFWLPPRGERRLAYLREERARDAGWGAPPG